MQRFEICQEKQPRMLECCITESPSCRVERWLPPRISATANDKALLAMHITAALVVDAAATRDETRGAHIRTDYGAGKDFWQHRYIMYQNGQKEVRLIDESTKTKTYA